MIKIFIVGCQQIYKNGLKANLNKEEDFIIAGEADDGNNLVEKISVAAPDVVIIDAQMTEGSGLVIASRIMKKIPALKIIILSDNFKNVNITQALKIGVKAYLPKNINVNDLLECIKKVHFGGVEFPDQFMDIIKNILSERLASEVILFMESLDAKEIEVLRMIAERKRKKEIANFLGCSDRSVYYIQKRIKEKLNIHKKAELIKYYNEIIT